MLEQLIGNPGPFVTAMLIVALTIICIIIATMIVTKLNQKNQLPPCDSSKTISLNGVDSVSIENRPEINEYIIRIKMNTQKK